jgi:predicted metal-binding protein
MNKRELERFCTVARELGALEAKIVATDKVFTADWVRLRCRYGCTEYGHCLTCPPYSPEPAETRRVLDEYKYAILLRKDRTKPLRQIGRELERHIFLAGCYKAFAYLCGPCRLCRECRGVDLDDVGGRRRECAHADLARPAMEAAGIDVFATVRAAGMPIEVVTSTSCKQDYYAMVLVD